MKKISQILSFLMVLALLFSLALPVLAETYYLEDGDIHIEATSTDGGTTQTQTVTQNSVSTYDASPVVTQRDSSTATSNNVTIESSGGATAVVTVEKVNISTGSDTSGGDTSPIDVVNGSQAIITVSGENHVHAGHETNGVYDDSAAVHVGDSTVVIQGDSSDSNADSLHVVNGATSGAAIGSDNDEDFRGNLTIRDVTVTTTEGNIGAGHKGDFSGELVIDGANVEAAGGWYGAGIGSQSAWAEGAGDFTGTLMITGQSTVTATGRSNAAGIGSGENGDYSGDVIVAEGSTVTATGHSGAAGIGSGENGDYSGTVIIAGSSAVTATGGYGPGIGSGSYGNYSGTVIQETGSTITATGGNDGIGLGSQGYPKVAKEAADVDLTGYPAPADPTPLPWNDVMLADPTPDPDSRPNPDPEPTPDPESIPDPDPEPVTPDEGTTAPGAAAPAPQAPAYDEVFWRDVEKQLLAAKKGDTVTIDAGKRTTMPAWIMDAIEGSGAILVIQWDGGEDITIEKPYDGEKKYTFFYLKDLADLLAD